jgi:hypothetical protein
MSPEKPALDVMRVSVLIDKAVMVAVDGSSGEG